MSASLRRATLSTILLCSPVGLAERLDDLLRECLTKSARDPLKPERRCALFGVEALAGHVGSAGRGAAGTVKQGDRFDDLRVLIADRLLEREVGPLGRV